MKLNVMAVLAVTLFLVGCSNGGGDGHGNEASLGDLEGTYVQVDDPKIELTLKGGHYQQGTTEIHAKGTYHAHPAGNDSFELHIELTGDLAGNETTIVIRMEGEELVVKDADSGEVLRFKKKS